MYQPKDVLVTVTVDSEQITRDNVKQSIVLTDDNGGQDQTPGDSCTFLSQINNGAQVTFRIEAVDQSTAVSFIAFNKYGHGLNVLNPMPHAPHWKATVSGLQQDTENYTITISVADKGEFTLDPGIEIKGP